MKVPAYKLMSIEGHLDVLIRFMAIDDRLETIEGQHALRARAGVRAILASLDIDFDETKTGESI